MVKSLPAVEGAPGLIPGSGRSPEEGKGNPLLYSCLEKSHGWRSLVGYSPWGCKELDMTDSYFLIQYFPILATDENH